MSNLTQEDLKRNVHYNPDTGLFTRIGTKSIIQTTDKQGYIVIKSHGKMYKAHRLAFLYMTGIIPEKDIDHKDTIRNNNKWENLREATSTQNGANSNIYITNSSGYKGVYWHKGKQKWRAQLKVNGKKITVGQFENIEDAAKAYEKAAIKYFGDFART